MKGKWLLITVACFSVAPAMLQAQSPAELAPGQNCEFVTQARADESAGEPNIGHDGTPLSGLDHEFWIRRGAEHMEKVFLFFDTVSRGINPGYITEDMATPPAR